MTSLEYKEILTTKKQNLNYSTFNTPPRASQGGFHGQNSTLKILYRYLNEICMSRDC